MIVSLTNSVQSILLVHLGALFSVWALVIGAAYLSALWLLNPPLSLTFIVQITSLLVGSCLVSQVGLMTLPQTLVPFLSQVLFPALYVLLGLYLFFRVCGRYLLCVGLSAPSMTRSTIVFICFSLLVLGAATVVSRFQLDTLTTLFSLTMDYLKYLLLCGCVALEYKAGSCVVPEQMTVVAEENDPYTNY